MVAFALAFAMTHGAFSVILQTVLVQRYRSSFPEISHISMYYRLDLWLCQCVSRVIPPLGPENDFLLFVSSFFSQPQFMAAQGEKQIGRNL